MVYGRLLETVLALSGQYVRLNKRKALAEDFGEKAHQKGGDNGALPNAVEPAEKEQRQHGGDHRHGGVENDLRGAEIRVPDLHHGAHERLPRQHDHIRQHLQVDAEAEHDAARHQSDELHGIALRLHPEQQVHGEVDEVPEHNGNGDLQDVNSELQRQGFCVFFC